MRKQIRSGFSAFDDARRHEIKKKTKKPVSFSFSYKKRNLFFGEICFRNDRREEDLWCIRESGYAIIKLVLYEKILSV